MLIKILEDTHDITRRLREIDKDYFIVYNTDRKCYEVHNYSQKNTFCLSIPYGSLDARTISLTLKTRREFLDKILAEIDKNNEKLEKDAKKEILDKTSWKLKEMFDFASRNEAENFDDAYITKWA